MTYRRLGDSDLTVSVVGIGTNAFSRRVDQDGVAGIMAAAREVGVTFIDTADAYGATYGASEEMIGEALQGQRDEFVRRDQVRRRAGGARAWSGRVTALRRRGGRGQPASAAHGPHRPLPVPLPRRRHADRGDALGAHRPRPRGEGPLRRLLEPRRLAGRRRGLDGAHARARAVRLGPEPLLPARPAASRTSWCRRARRSGSACCRTSRWPTGCSPASTSAARPRRRAPARQSTPAGRSGWRPPTGTGSRPWRRTPRSATSTLLDVAIAGLAAQPAVGSVICGVTSGDQVRANAAALRWQPSAADLAELDVVTGEES